MAEKGISPDSAKASKRLHDLWKFVLSKSDRKIDPKIDKLVNSDYVAIRFCLPTQLLGKLTDPELDCLCLQKGTGKDRSAWDPRSFATKVIVPWVAENQYVLGTSADPYVSKPLRKAQIEANPGNVKGKDQWELLYSVLKEVEDKNSEQFTEQKLLQALFSIHNKIAALSFEYYIPERISIEQTISLVNEFLSEGSGGDRGLSVAAALFETFGKFFNLYKEVRRHVINASDQSTGLVADIECIGENGELKLAIEVKERNLTLTDVRGAIFKARKVSLKELLFNSPDTEISDESEISDLIERTWASGTNLYRLSIKELIKVGLSLTGEEGRKDFISNIGMQLDKNNTQPKNRMRWKILLETI